MRGLRERKAAPRVAVRFILNQKNHKPPNPPRGEFSPDAPRPNRFSAACSSGIVERKVGMGKRSHRACVSGPNPLVPVMTGHSLGVIPKDDHRTDWIIATASHISTTPSKRSSTINYLRVDHAKRLRNKKPVMAPTRLDRPGSCMGGRDVHRSCKPSHKPCHPIEGSSDRRAGTLHAGKDLPIPFVEAV